MSVTDPRLLASSEPSAIGLLVGATQRGIADVQEYVFLAARSLTNVLTHPRYVTDLFEQMDLIGVGSLPIVLLTSFFIGAVMVLHTASQFTRFGQTALTGDVVAIALVRELGPTIAGLLVAGRCASGIASELGSMVVTEQVDAMRAMGTDPSRKLVSPRVWATLITLPLITTISVFVGLVGGMVASVLSLRINATTFWERAIKILEFS